MTKPLAIDLFCGIGNKPMARECVQCGGAVVGRPDKKFCSSKCYQRHWYDRPPFPYARNCRACLMPFTVASRDDANRQYCSQACSKLAQRKGSKVWLRLHPEKQAEYTANRLSKNKDYWRDQGRSERKRILEMLGGKCIVCGVANPSWLHVDYVPTTRNERFRHSRAPKFVSANLNLFRILCANHHYELTLTGKIEGTDIVQ